MVKDNDELFAIVPNSSVPTSKKRKRKSAGTDEPSIELLSVEKGILEELKRIGSAMEERNRLMKFKLGLGVHIPF